MVETVLTINHEAGLHARPLAKFVQKAKEYDADINVWNITRDKGPASGASPLKLMMLAVLDGHEIKISAEGAQAAEAVSALEELINSNFGEVEA